MRNICLIGQDNKNASLQQDYFSVVHRFRSFGYDFKEIRILFEWEEQTLKKTLKECKENFDNVFFLLDSALFLGVKSLVLSVFKNELSVAMQNCGVFQEQEKTLFLCCAPLMQTMQFVENVCVEYLSKKYALKLDKFVIRSVGASETRVLQLIAKSETLAQGKITCKRRRVFDEDVIEVFYDQNTPKMLLDDVLRIFAEGLEDSVYALEDRSLETQLVDLLKIRGKKISVAESFTGGAIAKRITSVSGASRVYFEGLNTYNEQSKMKRLGVLPTTLNTMGAVSDQTAYEMAAGLIATGDCDIAIATTGLAGPNTDSSGLPVGLCYIAIGTKETVFVYRYKFDGTRQEICEKAVNYALFLAFKQLKNA